MQDRRLNGSNELRFQTLVEQIPAIIYTAALDEHSRTLYVSPHIETILGFTPEEWMADPELWLKQMHPDDVEMVLEAVERAQSSETPVPLEYRALNRDGHVVWLHDTASVVRDETGRPLFLQGVTVDISERKRAEAALRASEERFRLMVQDAQDYALYSLSPSGHVESWNDGAERLKDYTADEIIGRHFSLFYTPEDRKQGKPQRLLAEAASLGHVTDEGWRVRKDGSRFWAAVIITALRGEGGRLRGFSKLIRDVSVRKHAEEEREELVARLDRERERAQAHASQLDAMFSAMSNGIVLYDRHGRIVRMNAAARGMFDSTTIGSIHPLVTRTHLFGPIGEDGQPITEASDLPEQRALRGETVEDVVLGLPNVQNREMCWVSLNAAPVRDADNQVVGAVLTAIDISGRVLAEQARRASEERYRALVEATPSAIVVADMDTRISMVTPQAVTLFGCKTADDLLGRSIFELIAPEDHEKAQHKIALALEHGSGRAEYTLLRCDGTRFLAALNAAIICDEEGRPQAITGVIRDITEERRAETQLRRSEERYRAIVEVSPDGIAQVTADLLCTIIVVNQRTLAMLDYCEEELLGRSAFDFIAREDHEKARADLDRIISLGHVDNAQYTLVRRDGSRFPAELSARMIANENGVPQSIIAVLRDISARKAAEGKIRSANERIVETLESITDAFVACDRNWRYTYVNERAAQMLGIPRDQLIGRNMWEMFPDVVNTPVYRACHQMMRERLPLTVEAFDWIKRRWYRNDIYPTREGLSIYWRDITERREVEEALRLSEERFRRYFELGLIGMAITSPDKTFLEVNDELCNMLGYDHDELVGLTWAELTPPDDLDTDLSQYERVLAGEIDGYALDKRYIRKDGQLIHATISVKCVRRADASIDYFIALLQDITERKAAEQEQARLLDAMEQLSRQLLLAQENERRHIARELHDEAGQSLTALKIQLEMLKADLLSANAALEHRLGTAVAMVDTTMERMRSLALALRPPALDALGLNAALEGYAQSFAEHTSLVVDYAAVELPIVPDTVAICLYRFLQEALTNIAKHAHARHVWIVLQRDAEEISLLVEDDGEGFDRARLRSSARRLTQLGLLGMRERLQLLGGRLDIDLRPERGVRLVAHIPRKEGL